MSGAAQPQPEETSAESTSELSSASPNNSASEPEDKKRSKTSRQVGSIFDVNLDTSEGGGDDEGPKAEERPTYTPPSEAADDHSVVTLDVEDAIPPEPSAPVVEITEDSIIIEEPEIIDGDEIEELDPEIEEALGRISDKGPQPPAEAENEGGEIIGQRDVAYISDAMFEAATDMSRASLTERESSSPSINERRRMIVNSLKDELGVEFSARVEMVHLAILEAAEAMIIKGKWIADDELLRKTLLLLLTTLDPDHYSITDKQVMTRRSTTLARAFLSELRKRGKSKLAHKISASREDWTTHYKPPTKK